MRFPPDLLRQCWFLAGPTACGKTAVGVALAERLDAEVVSLDSMTLYRGLNVGTAKPTATERGSIPHHLLDVLDPWAEFSVADYLAAAERVCREIVDRGRVPLFVGGTGLYLRSLLRGVFEGPSADWEYRRRLEAQAGTHPPGWLHAQLAQVDPAAAARLHPADERRLIRALEIHHRTGRPASEQQQEPPLPPDQRPPHVYWLVPPRDWLYERINTRVDQMIQQGLVDEVRRLLADPRGLSRTARQALGYKEIIEHLEGRRPLPEAVERLKTRTRQFAKRQHTWFRHLEECRPVPITGKESAAEIAARILHLALPGPDLPARQTAEVDAPLLDPSAGGERPL
jgi:tRNA dimethylallyltransferase